MCSKGSTIRRRKRVKKKTAEVGSAKPARKTRTKTRKPKYLSLKLELFPQQQQKKKRSPQRSPSKAMAQINKQQQQQLNLFPLHPENLMQDLQDENQQVAFLFETATDDTSTSLNSLLDVTTNTSSATTTTATTTTTSEDGPFSLYRGQDYHDQYEEVGCGDRGSSLLVRTAMRCKERDASEERWVSYCEVVKKEQEEVSSDNDYGNDHKSADVQGKKMGLVGLKLDYEEIMNAWSDKGPLYIEGESPQTVPDLQELGSMEDLWNLWQVPEMGGMKMGGKEGCKAAGQREASVMRYKEKRQSRLFAKKIRYEVRKLNAEKRPRLKGRFVKRSGEEE